MNETIHYISDISYITDINHLKKHIKYITRKGAKPIHSFSDEIIKTWIEKAKMEKQKRHDARIAMKFTVALPNDRADDKDFFIEVAEFFATFFHVDKINVDIAVHRDNPANIHMHVLIYPRDIKGRKLRITRQDLSRLHKEWDKFLEWDKLSQQKRYQIIRDEVENKIDHIGWRLHAYPEVKVAYQRYKANKKNKKQLQKQIESLEKKIKDIDVKIANTEVKITVLNNKIKRIVELQKKQKDEERKRILRERMFLYDIFLRNLEQADLRYQEIQRQIEHEKMKKQYLLAKQKQIKDSIDEMKSLDFYQYEQTKDNNQEETDKPIQETDNKLTDTNKPIQEDTTAQDNKADNTAQVNQDKIIMDKSIQEQTDKQDNIQAKDKSKSNIKVDMSGIDEGLRKLDDLLKRLNEIKNNKATQKSNITTNGKLTDKPITETATAQPKSKPIIKNETILTEKEKQVRNQVFGEEIYNSYSYKPEDNNLTKYQDKTYQDQTENDIKNILFGDQITTENNETDKGTDKDKGNDKDIQSLIDLQGFDLGI